MCESLNIRSVIFHTCICCYFFILRITFWILFILMRLSLQSFQIQNKILLRSLQVLCDSLWLMIHVMYKIQLLHACWMKPVQKAIFILFFWKVKLNTTDIHSIIDEMINRHSPSLSVIRAMWVSNFSLTITEWFCTTHTWVIDTRQTSKLRCVHLYRSSSIFTSICTRIWTA